MDRQTLERRDDEPIELDKDSTSVDSENGTFEELSSQVTCNRQHTNKRPTEMNVIQSPHTHVGDNIYTAEVTIAPPPSRDETDTRKAVVVRWCGSRRARIIHGTGWCLLLLVVAIYVIILLTAAKPGSVIDIGLNASWYKRRADWQALNPAYIQFLQLPIKMVLIGHTVSANCATVRACLRRTLALQQYAIGIRRMADMMYNFVVGGDGTILEGRGANVLAAHTAHYNNKSIGIAFVGNYNEQTPIQAQIEHLTVLLQQLVKYKVLSPDFKLYGVCQCSSLDSPGRKLMNVVKELPHWDSKNYKERC